MPTARPSGCAFVREARPGAGRGPAADARRALPGRPRRRAVRGRRMVARPRRRCARCSTAGSGAIADAAGRGRGPARRPARRAGPARGGRRAARTRSRTSPRPRPRWRVCTWPARSRTSRSPSSSGRAPCSAGTRCDGPTCSSSPCERRCACGAPDAAAQAAARAAVRSPTPATRRWWGPAPISPRVCASRGRGGTDRAVVLLDAARQAFTVAGRPLLAAQAWLALAEVAQADADAVAAARAAHAIAVRLDAAGPARPGRGGAAGARRLGPETGRGHADAPRADARGRPRSWPGCGAVTPTARSPRGCSSPPRRSSTTSAGCSSSSASAPAPRPPPWPRPPSRGTEGLARTEGRHARAARRRPQGVSAEGDERRSGLSACGSCRRRRIASSAS